jgi:hypothetical protein
MKSKEKMPFDLDGRTSTDMVHSKTMEQMSMNKTRLGDRRRRRRQEPVAVNQVIISFIIASYYTVIICSNSDQWRNSPPSTITKDLSR